MPTPAEITWLDAKVPAAQTCARQWGVPASITLAQCILESSNKNGWGQSQLALEANNYFGIKAVQGEDYAEFPAHEIVQGRSVPEMADFARYGTVLDSFAAHAHLLATLPRYRPAMAVRGNSDAFAMQLHPCGYSTSLSYGPELILLMQQLDLYQYDVPQSQLPAGAFKAA